jgi:hypothetical protein
MVFAPACFLPPAAQEACFRAAGVGEMRAWRQPILFALRHSQGVSSTRDLTHIRNPADHSSQQQSDNTVIECPTTASNHDSVPRKRFFSEEDKAPRTSQRLDAPHKQFEHSRHKLKLADRLSLKPVYHHNHYHHHDSTGHNHTGAIESHGQTLHLDDTPRTRCGHVFCTHANAHAWMLDAGDLGVKTLPKHFMSTPRSHGMLRYSHMRLYGGGKDSAEIEQEEEEIIEIHRSDDAPRLAPSPSPSASTHQDDSDPETSVQKTPTNDAKCSTSARETDGADHVQDAEDIDLTTCLALGAINGAMRISEINETEFVDPLDDPELDPAVQYFLTRYRWVVTRALFFLGGMCVGCVCMYVCACAIARLMRL